MSDLSEKNIKKIIPIFNENRIKILDELFKCQENKNVCGCDIVGNIDIPKNLLSYHIKFLKNEKLIEDERCGQKKNYRLTKKGIKFIQQFKKIEAIFKGEK